MITNHVRAKLRAGESSLGSFLGLGSPNVAELMAQVGFEWLVIETEHNALDSAEIQHMLMAMNGSEAIPLVRVPSADPVYIQRALDIGALGVVVPMVKTAAEANAVVEATRYPPAGSRGFGPLRAARYSLDNEDYLNRANDNILVVLIIEHKEAVENLEAIAKVPGVDVLFLGPFDLCLSMGLNPLEMPFPEIDTIANRTVEIAKANGMTPGIGVGAPEQLKQRGLQGFRFLAYGPDSKLLLDAAQEGLNTFKNLASRGC